MSNHYQRDEEIPKLSNILASKAASMLSTYNKNLTTPRILGGREVPPDFSFGTRMGK